MPKKDIRLSYSYLNDLLCPYRYWKVHIEVIDRRIDISAVVGTVIHNIYEDVINKYIVNFSGEKPRKFFDIKIDEVVNKITENIDRYIQAGFFLTEPFSVSKLTKLVFMNLSEEFLSFLWLLRSKGYSVISETSMSVRNPILDLEVVGIPDIFILGERTLIVIDIKTSRLRFINFNRQIIFYSYIIKNSRGLKVKYNLNLNEIELLNSYVFLTRYNKLLMVNQFQDLSHIEKEFENIIEDIRVLYYDIFSFEKIDFDIMKTIYDRVEQGDEETIYILQEEVKRTHACKFCPVKGNCPIIG